MDFFFIIPGLNHLFYAMWVSNKRPRQLNYSVNVKWAKSGNKVGNAVKHYKKLQERLAFEGQTKWLQNALVRVLTKFKKYSVNINKI